MLYTVYTNKIPQLYKLMTNDDYYKMTKTILLYDYDKITHETLNYVDDSTNIISTTDTGQLQLYINDFYRLLETYYDINKLKINADKSKILIICRHIYRRQTDSIILKAADYTIYQTDTIRY